MLGVRLMGDSCWMLVGDEMLWWVIVVGCWLVMKCGCLRMEVGLLMLGVEALHMLCERPAHVVRMVSTNGVEG